MCVCVCVCVRARVRFLYPRPKKPTHIVNCHVEGVKREENISSSSTCSLLCTTTFKRPRRFTCEYTYILLVHAYKNITLHTLCIIYINIYAQRNLGSESIHICRYILVFSRGEVAEANNTYL